MQVALAVFIAMTTASCSAVSGTGRPTGANCSLESPPVGSGEETGRGVLLQVFPRTGSLGSGYTGCQAVFVTTRDRPVALGWLVELSEGDPVRIWSNDPDMKSQLSCRFRRGLVVTGDPKVCNAASITLLPTMPAGCALNRSDQEKCEYDSE
jgi:hypothetical protein